MMLFGFTLILTACSRGEVDVQEYSGIIGDGKALGYEYTITKEQNKFSWKVGYKGHLTFIEESAASKENLVNYMHAVNDSKLVLLKLVLSVSYFLVIMITTLILYRKNRKILKSGSAIIAILAGFAIYAAIKASIDLSNSLQEAKYYYLLLTN